MGMMLTGRHLASIVLIGTIITLSVSALMFWTSPFSKKSATHASVGDAVISCTVIDNEIGLPVSDIEVEMNLSTPRMRKITVSGFTMENGSIEKAIANWDDSFLQIDDIILAGNWIIQDVAGDRVYRTNERLWNCTDAKSFLLGYSEYSFNGIRAQEKLLKDHLELALILYVYPARMLAVSNPIQERVSTYITGSRGFRGRGSLVEMIMTDSNFVDVENTDFVLIPENHPLKVGVLIKILDFAWNFITELDVTNREFIDLTPAIMREFFDRQIQEAINMLDIMSSQGFDLRKQYEDLEKAREDYDYAINAFSSANYSEGLNYAQNGWMKYLGVYTQVREIHSETLPWAIAIISILAFFSLTSARLITQHKANRWKIPLLIFPPFFLLFSFTQPYLRLFLLSPFTAIEKLDIIFFVNFLAVLPWLFFAFILSIAPRFRDVLWETVEMSLRNIHRRRLRSIMTIFTITIVSASAMSVLTISPYTPSLSIPLSGAQPTVQQGLLVEQYETLTPIPSTVTSPGQAPQVVQIQIALPTSEATWLTKQPWVDSFNIYGLKRITIANSTSQNIADFSRFNLVILNPSFIEKYYLTDSNVSWLTDKDKGEVLIGSKIASAHNLSPGEEFFIDDKVFKVKDIFDEQQITKNCEEIHGGNFFAKVYDPVTGTISGESFIIGSINDFSPKSFSIYKVSMRINSSYIDDLDSIVNDILQRGYSHEITTEHDVTRTYKIYAVIGGKVTCRFYSATESTIVGPWPMQVVLLILSAGIVSLNVLASVSERKKEIQTIFASGAAPLRIRMIFIAEAIIFGLLGGIYGYVLMFSLVEVGNLALPNLIQENLLSSSPFLISLSTGIIASIIGSVPISTRAVLSVVPSERMLQKDKDIFTKQRGRIVVDVPLKLQESELESFSNFITHLGKKLTPRRFYFDGIGIFDIERVENEERIVYVLTMNYSAEKNAFYKAVISIQKGGQPDEIEVIVYPLNAMRRVVKKWRVEHNITLSRFAAQFRSKLVRYVGTKRNNKHSKNNQG